MKKAKSYDAIISAVTQSVHKSINLEEVLENTAQAIIKNIPKVKHISIYLVEGEEAVLKAYRGYPKWFIERVRRIPYPKGFTWKTIMDGKPRYCADVDKDEFIGPAGREAGTKSYVSMPIHFQNKTIGIININSFRKNAFNKEEINLLETVTQQIEIAINNARHAEALRKAHDELEILVQERTAKLEEINEELRTEIEERKRAEEELRKSEERLQTILDSSTTVIYIKDTESQYITVNRQYETLFHIEREQLKGKTDYDIFPKNLADAFQANDQKVIMAKAPLEFQEIALHDDGLHTYISIKFPLYDSAGTLYAVCGISTDITERIKAREALQRAKDELKVRVQERTAELKKVNKQLRVEIEERKSIEETLQESAARLEEINEELGAEIVEHKRTETALQESEERYRTLVENAPEAIVVLDVEKGCFADANEKAAHLFNLTRAELLSHGPIDLSPPVQPDGRPSSESAVEKIRHAIEGGTSRFEWIHRNSQGEDIPCEVSLVRLPSATRTLIRGSVVDITKRKQAEKILRESEERFRLLVEGVKDYAIFMLDTKGYIASWNAGAERIKGYKSEEIIGKHFSIFYSEEDIENSKPQHGLDVAIRDGRYEDEGWRVRKDGSRFWTNVVITALRDGYGNLRGFSKVTRDITGHKQAEEALKRISHQMELILDSAGEGICGLDIDGNITFTNPSGVKMIEWEAEEIIGKSMHDIMHHSRPDGTQYQLEECPIYKSLKNGSTYHVDNEVFWRKDREGFPVEYISTPIQEGDRVVGAVVTFSDITERKKMEEDRLNFSKLESIGVLAGGIAHDFNNMLAAMLSTISVARMDTRTGTNLHNNLIEAESICLQARGLTQQLLTFSKGGAPVKKLTSIERIIRESTSFALRGSNVRCEFSIEDNLWDVEADPGQIAQVISNLAINAQQSMPQGGVIKISTKNTELGRGFIPAHIKGGNYVKITIEDEGVGIPREHLSKIFDPYFTTKQRGSGLGLATTYSIIKSHDGFIDVESELGKGSSFHVYIPASEKRVSQRKAEPEKRTEVKGRGRVLIMDDEAIIRTAAGRAIMRMGYEVEYAKGGEEAIEIYTRARDENRPFDLVIMDLTIPGGIGGREAIAKLMEIDPDVRAVVSSGYSNDPVMSEHRRYGFRGVVAKPYDIEELAEILNKVIDGK